ncbi:MAG: STAS domain-containing protein [Clostridia bacterium]|nr:STAS domain-containing protein [Clostridia bacterium]
MNIGIKKNAEETIIEITGRLDTITAPELEKTIESDASDVTKLILDVNGMEYISSAGLRVLLSEQKKMSKRGTMTVKNVRPEVMEVLEITGFTDILTIE